MRSSTFKLVAKTLPALLLMSAAVLLLPAVVAAQEQKLVTNLDTVEWGPPGGGNGSPLGLQTARLGVDAETRGITYYAKFPAGSRFDLHWHTHDEFVVVVSGEVDIVLGHERHALAVGSYIVIPGTMNHSWHVPTSGDVVILVRRAGPADFHFVK